MNITQQIQTAELSIEEAKKIVAFGEAIARLEKNRDFRTVILDGYFNAEACRLVYLTADSTLDEKAQAGTWNDIRGIGALREFLRVRKGFAEMAEKELRDHRETLEELRGEEAAGEGA